MENILFIEKQQFRQTWIWGLLIGIFILTLWGFIQQVVLGIPWGNDPGSNIVMTLFTLLPAGLLWLFRVMYLKTEITNEEIRISFYPFINKTYQWEEIEKAYIRQYKPLTEFGGWGIRNGAKGMAYNVSGNMGLQLVLRNGKKLLIGTQLPDELGRVVNLIHPFV